ncbi:MAG TPA: hypothetical protein VGC42_30485 [Kofleriaceae bacterium]
MRSTAPGLAILAFAGLAHADTFTGFSGVDRPYLVNQDRVCAPIAVTGGKAAGAPKCDKVGADVVARLSIKPGAVQSGSAAAFIAQAEGRTLTVSKKTGGAVVAWDAADPIVKVIDVYASQYADRVAVAYNVRRAGREVTDVVAFDLGQATAPILPEPPPVTPVSPGIPDAKADPKVDQAVAAARARPKAAAGWQAVIALDPGQPEALFRLAALDAAAKRGAEAIASLGKLGAAQRPDAVEWQVEARFDPAFAGLRADPRFRAAVGLDRKPATTYERLMGFGGQWEQSGTSCDRPEVRLVASRDRKIRIKVKTTCEGQVFDTEFKGTWRLDGQRVVVQLPNQGKVTSADEAGCTFEAQGDEDALRCGLGRDIDFVVLPTRR